MNKLFTVRVSFSDHLVGVEQYEAESAELALKKFIEFAESLKGYNRELLATYLMPLIHVAHLKGVWLFYFTPGADLTGDENNPILGGQITQTDPDALVRP
jgi:hypothetical protein